MPDDIPVYLSRYGGAWGSLEDITSLFVCADCGAVVHHRGMDTHNNWHDRKDEQ